MPLQHWPAGAAGLRQVCTSGRMRRCSFPCCTCPPAQLSALLAGNVTECRTAACLECRTAACLPEPLLSALFCPRSASQIVYFTFCTPCLQTAACLVTHLHSSVQGQHPRNCVLHILHPLSADCFTAACLEGYDVLIK